MEHNNPAVAAAEAAQQEENICFHHFSLTFAPSEVSTKFKDVKFVFVAGCSNRAESQANYLVETLFTNQKHQLERLTKPTSRFVLFKLGPVLVSNHGMGAASMSIALHELFLMCQQAGVIRDITIIRFGTCK